MNPRAMLTLAVALLVSTLSSCYLLTKPAVSIEFLRARTAQEHIEAKATRGTEPTELALEALHAFDLEARYEEDPKAALAELHTVAARENDRRVFGALAELRFARANKSNDRDEFLSAAIYAYLYLFGDAQGDPPDPYDRRFRRACDIYNVGLQFALTSKEPELELCEQERKLPVGSVTIHVDSSRFEPGCAGTKFLAADDFVVHGLSVHHRNSGLGVAAIAVPNAQERRENPNNKYLARGGDLPVCAFLRLQGGIADIEHGLTATLELYDAHATQQTTVGSAKVPLEIDYTATLAYTLHDSELWNFSLEGFFSGERDKNDNGLGMPRPYAPGRVPVVFVHGTASNPAYWAEMFNTLEADPALRGRIQCWFFKYRTGNPVAYSAAQLRDALLDVVKTLDPQGKDPALRRMVVVGHSQGGLLARMVATHGDLSWIEDATGRKVSDFGFSQKQLDLLQRSFVFEPVPSVKREIFISTPHRGSYLADSWISRFSAKLIALPREVVDVGQRLVKDNEKLPPELRNRIPTALDNMNPSNPFLVRLEREPISPDVTYHSIIAVQGDGPIEEGRDGVVAYKSAHLDGAESEFVVRSGHSCQQHPLVIREVRRILLEHLDAAKTN